MSFDEETIIILQHLAECDDPYFRDYSKNHHLSNETIILTAKAMDFLDYGINVEKT